jgi:hypothetical protein
VPSAKDDSVSCVQVNVSCDDGNPCTLDECISVGNSGDWYCNNDLIGCEEYSNACNVATCNPQNGRCDIFTPVVCDDRKLTLVPPF